MNIFSRFSVLILIVLSLSFSIQDAFAAKRLGGGGSVGRQRDTQTMQRAPTPAPVAPGAARPNAPGVPGNAAAPAPVRPQVAPAPVPQRNSWMGPLAGFAGGALLGGLLFGGHGGGFGGGDLGGGLMSILFMGLLVAGFVFLVRRFLFSNAPQQYAEAAPAGWAEVPPQTQYSPQGSYGTGSAQPAMEQAPLNLPPGFDLPGFIREAKLAYVRLQAANDAADLNDLRLFTTPQMYAEISIAIQERGGVQQRVEVLTVDAQLLDLIIENNEAIASVQYHATIREDQGAPELVNEIWHVRKLLNDPHSSWLLAGIQQVA